MSFCPQYVRRVVLFSFFLMLVFAFGARPTPLLAAERMHLQVNDYQIDAVVTPSTHRLSARARLPGAAGRPIGLGGRRGARRGGQDRDPDLSFRGHVLLRQG